MELRVLGPLEVLDDDGRAVDIDGGKRRALLALFALNANRALPVTRIVDDVWGEHAPETAAKSVQILVSHLRKKLGADAIKTRGRAYELELDPDAIDLLRFERLAGEGSRSLTGGDANGAARLLREALSLWRGPALVELSEPFAESERPRLEERRLACTEKRIEAELALGRHAALVGELDALVERHPLREGFWAQLMIALYRCGRQADALAAYRDLRRRLDEELGIEPSQRLRELERLILGQDESLELPLPGRPAVEEPATAVKREEESAPGEPSPPLSRLGPERRTIAVLVCDLADSAGLAAKLDPEELHSVVAEHQRTCAQRVEAYGGSVARFEESRVVAFFGYPSAHEDDARRAVCAALDVAAAEPRRASVRAGVETGLVVVDAMDAQGAPQALGETPGVAAELARRAGPGDVLVGPRADRLLRDYFETEPVADGDKSAARGSRRVLRATGVTSRFEAAARRGLSPYVGRSRELEALRSALAEAASGRGQLVTIGGPPGAGKSRLVLEFSAWLDREAWQILRGSCTSLGAFGADTSYFPFVDVLAAALDGAPATTTDERPEAVAASVVRIDRALERYVPYYLHLLSLASERYPLPPRFMGEEKRRAYEESLAALLTVSSRRRPLVVVLEDWHWADEASDSALGYLAGAIEAFPILLVVTHRPERRIELGELPNQTPLALRALLDDATAALVAARLGASSLPPGLADAVHARTDGNPLFVEELCDALVEDGTVVLSEGLAVLTRPVDRASLPETVQAVILSRLDRLDPESLEVVRRASVVGQTFRRDVLERIVEAPERLNRALERLVSQGLVSQIAVVPEPEYAFKHALTQIVAYETLLLGRRRELHARVGAALEAIDPERLAQLADTLAFHFDLGEIWEKAAAYHVRAGVKAFDHHVLSSALDHFARAEAIISEHAPPITPEDRFDLAFFRGAALGDTGRWPAAYDAISEADAVAAEHDLGDRRSRALFARANAAFWSHRFDDSLRIASELETLVGDDLHARLGVSAMQALTSFMCERLSESLTREDELRMLLDRVPDSPHVSRAAFVLGVFSRWRGDSREAESHLRLAVEHDRERASVGVYLQSLLHYCLALGELGRHREAIDLLVEGRERGVRADSLYGVLKIDNTLGWLYQELCNYPEAMRYNELSLLSTGEARGSDTSTLSEIDVFARLNLGDLHLALGEAEQAKAYFDTALSHVDDDRYVLARTRWQARCLLGYGEAALETGELAVTGSMLDRLDEHGFTDGFPFRKLQARALRLRARVLDRHGEHEPARRLLRDALRQAAGIANPGELWRTQVALGESLASAGESERARGSFREAAAVLAGIGEQLGEPLREQFLASRPVEDVFARAESGRPSRGRI